MHFHKKNPDTPAGNHTWETTGRTKHSIVQILSHASCPPGIFRH